jgi:hypothetical protein
MLLQQQHQQQNTSTMGGASMNYFPQVVLLLMLLLLQPELCYANHRTALCNHANAAMVFMPAAASSRIACMSTAASYALVCEQLLRLLKPAIAPRHHLSCRTTCNTSLHQIQ